MAKYKLNKFRRFFKQKTLLTESLNIDFLKSSSKGRKNSSKKSGVKNELNCSSESTVQNNSYKLNSTKEIKERLTVLDTEIVEPKHFRKKSAATYNFFLNKHSAQFNAKNCKSNNISFRDNDSFTNTHRLEKKPEARANKLEKYFQKVTSIANPTKTPAQIPNPNVPNLKGTLFNQLIKPKTSKTKTQTPKTFKELSALTINTTGSKFKISEKKKDLNVSPSKSRIKEVDLTTIFVNEQLLYDFLISVYQGEDIYDLFKTYIEFVQENEFEVYLTLVEPVDLVDTFKNAFILERMSLMICFYLLINGLFKKEIIFLRKIAFLAYSNIFIFLKCVLNDQKPSQLDVN